MLLAFLDIPAEYTQEYNRWYDLDHLPEHVAKADVVAGRRYVAPWSLRDAPGAVTPEWGHPPYVTTYLFGGPLPFTSEEAASGWQEKDRTIVRAGRYWREGRGVCTGRWHLEAARPRPGCLVSEEAVPHLAHRGIIVALGRAPAPDRRPDAVAWWERTHLVDLFSVPGMLAALRFRSDDQAQADLVLHLLLCQDHPGDVMVRMDDAMRYHRAQGRFPAHGGVYEHTALLPYDRIVPLEYGFDVGPGPVEPGPHR